MSSNKNYLIGKSVYFYSMNDEKMFFEWIKNIECIKKFEGAGDELYLDLVGQELNYNDIKDLIALFYRYQIDMKQLAPFLNEGNKQAFAPWDKEIFGAKKSKISKK
jgi:hypothetical protein